MPLLVAFAVALAVSLLVVRRSRSRRGAGLDHDLLKPQKIHSIPVPRVGGLGIVLGLVAAGVAMELTVGPQAALFAALLLACAAPAFVAGITQDYTEALTPRGRLLATAVSAILAFFLMGAAIRYTAIPGLDWVVSSTVGALIVTVFAVSGIAHAINIIDGLNGLASMCVMIMLAAVAYVAFQVGDSMIALLALAGVGAVAGFFVWNFPAGLVFLGDGGAYFLGFFLAELGILLLVRNSEVSPLFPLLVCIYPAFETVFSIYRRAWLRQQPASMPDGIHLHSLLYRRVMRWAVGGQGAKAVNRRNSKTSPILWVLCSVSVVPAVLFWNDTHALAAFLLLFAISYMALYRRIVRFRSPRWVKVWASAPAPLRERDNRGT